MKKEDIKKALLQLRRISKKRNFKQSVDLVLNFKELDKKYTLDLNVNLPFDTGKQVKVCVIVDDLESKAKGVADHVINKAALGKLSSKEISKLAKEYDIFVAQSSLMGQIATVLGRTLGPLGKMPNPRAGGVLMPGAEVKSVLGKFKKGFRIRSNNEASVKVVVGKEDFNDDDLVENIHVIYDSVAGHLPHGEGNIKDALLKFTMSKPVRIGKVKVVEEKDEGKKRG